MAKLNGIEIKRLTASPAHEYGAVYSAVVYANGRKVGTWAQDPWGGPDSYSKGLYDIIKRQSNILSTGVRDTEFSDIYSAPDVFMNVLQILVDIERVVKRLFKNGFGTVVLIPSDDVVVYGIKGTADEAYIKKVYGNKDGFEDHMTIYEPSLSITVDAEHPLPHYLILH